MSQPVETRQRDFLVGLFVVTAVGVVLGGLGLTSGLTQKRYDLYMLAETAQDLTEDTRVFLQGLAIGRVRQVNPYVREGRLSFVVRLGIDETFPDGTPLTVPRDTRAVIAQVTPIAAPVIQLVIPDEIVAASLEPGDTIPSERRSSAMDALGSFAEDLSQDLLLMLEDTRQLMVRATETLEATNSLMESSAPKVDLILDQVSESMARTERILAEVEPRIGPMQDSVMLALSETRRVIGRLDTIAATAQTMTEENKVLIERMIKSFSRSVEILEHFADQVSRRPLRFITGVNPPESKNDSTEN